MHPSSAVPGTAIPETLMRVKTRTAPLNCRTAPGPTAPIVGLFARDALVTASRRDGDWLCVTDGVITGWAAAAYLAEAVASAVETLVKAGILDAPAYWLARHRDIPGLDKLLVSLSELAFRGGPVESVEAAIEILHRVGVLDAPARWRECHAALPRLAELLRRAAGAL